MILMNASGTFSDCNELVFISLFLHDMAMS